MVIPRAKFPLCSGDLFDSADFVAATCKSDRVVLLFCQMSILPSIIVLKKLPVTGGNLCAINLLRD